LYYACEYYGETAADFGYDCDTLGDYDYGWETEIDDCRDYDYETLLCLEYECMEYDADNGDCLWTAAIDSANPAAEDADYGCDLWFDVTTYTNPADEVLTKDAHCACHETEYTVGPGNMYRYESYLGVYPNKFTMNE
jgi:hypothetical protein